MNNFCLCSNHFILPGTAHSRHWRFIWFLPLVLLCLFVLPKPVQAQTEDPTILTPCTVNLSLAILDIPKIDEATETFDIDAYLDIEWKDPTAYDELVKNGLNNGVTYQSSSTDEALATLKNIGWFYIVEFANQAKKREILYSTLKIEPDGNIQYCERLLITLRSEYKLYKYPFDSQSLRIRIESSGYDASKMIFKADRIVFYRPIGSIESCVVLEDWALSQEIMTEAGTTHSQLSDKDWPYIEIKIEADRKFGYHLWKIFLPLVLIIFISWSVFWIEKAEVSSRLSLALIGFLTAISFGFITSSGLPEIPYLTLMDYTIIGIYVFMTLTVIEVVSTYILANYGKEAAAATINLHSRWAFPLALVCYLFALVFMV